MNEQKIETTTIVNFDFIDRIKILFGRRVELKVKSMIPFKQPEISSFNSVCDVSLVKRSKYAMVGKSHPDYGYTCNDK